MEINFYCKCNNDEVLKVRELTDYILSSQTSKTYEAMDVRIKFKNLTSKFVKFLSNASICNFNLEEATSIINRASEFDMDAIIGVYRINKYVDAFAQLATMLLDIMDGSCDYETRQWIINFEKLHCFQYMQFLYRNNEINVICNMRSCNYEVNFLTDLFLALFMGDMFKSSLQIKGKEVKATNVTMNIGSLHIIKRGE